MTVYLDEVFLKNAVADYLLLLAAARLQGAAPKKGRIFLASCLGGGYATVLYLPAAQWFSIFFIKMLVPALMTALAYGFSGKFLRKYLLFLLVSGAFAGIELMLAGFVGGTPLFSLPFFACSFLICYVLLGVTFRGGASAAVKGQLLDVMIEKDGKRLRLKAFADSGCTVSDPRDGKSVLIVEERALRPLPAEEEITLLPIETVCGTGVLRAFRCDKVAVGGQILQNALVAAYDHQFNGPYQALWGGGTEGRKQDAIACLAEGMGRAFGTAAAGSGVLHRRQRHTAAAAESGGGSGTAAAAAGAGGAADPD